MPLREFTFFVASLMSIVALSIDALLPAFGFLIADLGVANVNQVQLVISALFLGLALGQLVCGPLSDAFGRKPVLYVSLVIYLIGTLICYLSQSLDMLLFGRIVQGLGVSGPNVTAITLVRDQYKGRQMAKIMSMVMMIFIMVPTIAPAVGQLILLIADWRMIFVLYTFYALAIGAWVFIRLPESLPESQRIPFEAKRIISGFKEVLNNRSTLSLAIAIGSVLGCLIGYINSCQQIIQVQFGAGKMFVVYFGMLACLIGISSFINSRVVERLGMHFLASAGLAMIVFAALLLLIAQQFVTVQLWMFLCFAAFLLGSFGFISGNINAMALEPMGHLAGIATAVIGSLSSIMAITIGTTIGQLYDGTVFPIALGSIIMTSIAWCLVQYAQSQQVATSKESELA